MAEERGQVEEQSKGRARGCLGRKRRKKELGIKLKQKSKLCHFMSFNGKIQIKVDKMTKLKIDEVKGENWDDRPPRGGCGGK